MRKKENNKSTWFISTVIAFLLSIFVTMLSYLGGIYFGIFNKTILLDSMNTADYYSSIMEYTLDKVSSLAIPLGLDETIFDGVFTLEETSSEGKKLIQANLDGEDYTPDLSGMKKRLTDNINNYLYHEGLTANDEQKANIDKFVGTIADQFSANLKVPYISYYTQVRNLFVKVFWIGMPILVVLSAAAVILLIRLYQWWHKGLRFITYATLAATIMTAVLPLALLISGVYKRIHLSPEYFYYFMVRYINRSLTTFMIVSALLLAVSAAFICVIYYRRKSLKNAAHEHSRRHHEPSL